MTLKDLKRITTSFKYALQGIAYVISSQRNMQIHLMVTSFVFLLSVFLEIPATDLIIVFFAIVFVMCMELINTAVEKTVDLITKDYHQLAKIAKDVAAGAVMFAAIFAFVVGLYVFTGPLLQLFSIQFTIPLESAVLVLLFTFFISFMLKKVPFYLVFIVVGTLLSVITLLVYRLY
jgi:diacylglycerol kinase